MLPCDSCLLVKAKNMEVKKLTAVKAENVDDRVYADMSGPFNTSLGGSQYWLQMVNDLTCMGYCYFMSSKDQI